MHGNKALRRRTSSAWLATTCLHAVSACSADWLHCCWQVWPLCLFVMQLMKHMFGAEAAAAPGKQHLCQQGVTLHRQRRPWEPPRPDTPRPPRPRTRLRQLKHINSRRSHHGDVEAQKIAVWSDGDCSMCVAASLPAVTERLPSPPNMSAASSLAFCFLRRLSTLPASPASAACRHPHTVSQLFWQPSLPKQVHTAHANPSAKRCVYAASCMSWWDLTSASHKHSGRATSCRCSGMPDKGVYTGHGRACCSACASRQVPFMRSSFAAASAAAASRLAPACAASARFWSSATCFAAAYSQSNSYFLVVLQSP